MELLLARHRSTDHATLGSLFIDGTFACFTLEPDEDDGPHPAIPPGRYRVIITWSNRFHRQLPIVIDVPWRSGIRIHPGNTADDTEGCILLGQTQAADSIGQSRLAVEAVQHELAVALANHEDCFLTVSQQTPDTKDA